MLNKKPILDTHRAHNLQFILVLVLAFAVFVMGIGIYVLYQNNREVVRQSNVVGTNTDGVAFDWKNNKVLNDYSSVAFMPEGWSYVTFDFTTTDNVPSTWGLWLPTADPSIGSRTIELGQTGDDVKALKVAINNLQPADAADEFYFPTLAIDGNYDAATVTAVQKLQAYFSLETTGTADIDFQRAVYKQLVEPPTV